MAHIKSSKRSKNMYNTAEATTENVQTSDKNIHIITDTILSEELPSSLNKQYSQNVNPLNSSAALKETYKEQSGIVSGSSTLKNIDLREGKSFLKNVPLKLSKISCNKIDEDNSKNCVISIKEEMCHDFNNDTDSLSEDDVYDNLIFESHPRNGRANHKILLADSGEKVIKMRTINLRNIKTEQKVKPKYFLRKPKSDSQNYSCGTCSNEYSTGKNCKNTGIQCTTPTTYLGYNNYISELKEFNAIFKMEAEWEIARLKSKKCQINLINRPSSKRHYVNRVQSPVSSTPTLHILKKRKTSGNTVEIEVSAN